MHALELKMNLLSRSIKVHGTNYVFSCLTPVKTLSSEVNGKSIGELQIRGLYLRSIRTVHHCTLDSWVDIVPIRPKQQPVSETWRKMWYIQGKNALQENMLNEDFHQ